MSTLTARGAPIDGRSVLVMGLGLFGGGLEATRAALRAGARVTVTDLRTAEDLAESVAALEGSGAELVLGGHRVEDFEAADLVIANPAVRPDHPLLAAARAAGAVVTSEFELFLEACPARVVLVTGTQGKSSTCAALTTLLDESGIPARLGGNIGRSLLPELDELGADDVCVLETSSYQLEALPERAVVQQHLAQRVAAVAVINVLADHLERHGDLATYAAAKRRILEFAGPGTAVVLSGDDPTTRRWEVPGTDTLFFSVKGRGDVVLDHDGRFRRGEVPLGRSCDVRLPGEFQRANVLCALAIAHALGADPARLAVALPRVRGLDHRMQDLGEFAGHRVWDNGISTTPDSTLSAVRTLTGPYVWLVGGRHKDLPIDELAAAARGRARVVIAFGEAAPRLAELLGAHGLDTRVRATLDQAVRAAFAELAQGEPLLFSPACSSFDEFRNVLDRARAFRAALPIR